MDTRTYTSEEPLLLETLVAERMKSERRKKTALRIAADKDVLSSFWLCISGFIIGFILGSLLRKWPFDLLEAIVVQLLFGLVILTIVEIVSGLCSVVLLKMTHQKKLDKNLDTAIRTLFSDYKIISIERFSDTLYFARVLKTRNEKDIEDIEVRVNGKTVTGYFPHVLTKEEVN